MSALHVVRCRAPRRSPRFDGERCGGFVAQVPWPFMVAGIIPHSARGRPEMVVASCGRCGALHEIQEAGVLAEKAVDA